MNKTVVITTEELEEILILLSEKIIDDLATKQLGKNTLPELMTTAQAAAYLQCSPQSIKNWTNRNDEANPLNLVSAGADPRYFKSEINEWLKREAANIKKRRKTAKTIKTIG